MCLPKPSFMVSICMCVFTWSKERCFGEHEILANDAH